MDAWMSYAEVEAVLGISRRVLRRMAREGRVRTCVDPLNYRRRLVRRADVQRLLSYRVSAGAVGSGPEPA